MEREPESRFVAVNGITLHYLSWESSGVPLVFLHANSHCAGVWVPVVQRLRGPFRIYALDMRGHGLSDKPELGYDWGTLRDDLVGFLEALDLTNVVLIGHSRGGGASILAACAAPERVAAAVFYEPTMALGQQPMGRDRSQPPPPSARGERALQRRAVFASQQEVFDSYRPRTVFKAWTEEALWAYIKHGTKANEDGTVELLCPPWVEARLYDEISYPDEWIGIRNDALPVLACYGELSGRVQPDRDPAAALRRIFPRCNVHVLPGATHFGPMERPEAFANVLEDFLSKRFPGLTSTAEKGARS